MSCPGASGNNRRDFIRKTSAAGAAAGLIAGQSQAHAWQNQPGQGDDAVPRAVLGRTEAKVTKLYENYTMDWRITGIVESKIDEVIE